MHPPRRETDIRSEQSLALPAALLRIKRLHQLNHPSVLPVKLHMRQPSPPKPVGQTKSPCGQPRGRPDRKLEVPMVRLVHRNIPLEMHDRWNRERIHSQIARETQLGFRRSAISRLAPPMTHVSLPKA